MLGCFHTKNDCLYWTETLYFKAEAKQQSKHLTLAESFFTDVKVGAQKSVVWRQPGQTVGTFSQEGGGMEAC